MTVWHKRFLILNALNVYDVILTGLFFAFPVTWRSLEGNPIMGSLPFHVAVLFKISFGGAIAAFASVHGSAFQWLARLLAAVVTWNCLVWLPWLVAKSGQYEWALFMIGVAPWAWLRTG